MRNENKFIFKVNTKNFKCSLFNCYIFGSSLQRKQLNQETIMSTGWTDSFLRLRSFEPLNAEFILFLLSLWI